MITRSNSIFATLSDSVVDIMSQAVIAFAAYTMKVKNPKYPVGRTRLETVGVIISAGIMSVCSIEVLQSSGGTLYEGFALGKPASIHMDALCYATLAIATTLKLGLYWLCAAMRRQSAAALALAEDHLNDILSNAAAICTAAIASNVPRLWWTDAVGGAAIAIYIFVRWVLVAREHVDKLVGRAADESFVEDVTLMVHNHHKVSECKHNLFDPLSPSFASIFLY